MQADVDHDARGDADQVPAVQVGGLQHGELHKQEGSLHALQARRRHNGRRVVEGAAHKAGGAVGGGRVAGARQRHGADAQHHVDAEDVEGCGSGLVAVDAGQRAKERRLAQTRQQREDAVKVVLD